MWWAEGHTDERLYLTVEGQTEAAFASNVLTPHLVNFGVFLSPPRFTGLHRRRRGRIPQGGLLNTFARALADIQKWLKEDQSADARFSMMVDLYSLPHDFPGYAAGMAMPTGREKADALQRSLRMRWQTPGSFPTCNVTSLRHWCWSILPASAPSTMLQTLKCKRCVRSARTSTRRKTSTWDSTRIRSIGSNRGSKTTTRMWPGRFWLKTLGLRLSGKSARISENGSPDLSC